jgi:predicted transcriptional regulator
MIMPTPHNMHLNIPLNFNQVVDLVKQLSPRENSKLLEVLEREQEIIASDKYKNRVRQGVKASESDLSRIKPG